MPSAITDPPSDAAFAESYHKLRGLADAYLRRHRGAATLQATALVHEAYLKLAADGRGYADEDHFIRTAALAMRQVLVDRARARASLKRGGGYLHVTLDDTGPSEARSVDVLELNDALERLRGLDAQQAGIVELRCFLGVSVAEAARILHISPATVKRDWVMARAWLLRELRP